MYKCYTKHDMNVKCPYFKRESRLQIACEGISTADAVALKFETQEQKKEYMERECYRFPNECKIAAVVEEKYK